MGPAPPASQPASGWPLRETPVTDPRDAPAPVPSDEPPDPAGDTAAAPVAADPPPHFRAHVFVCGNRRPDGHPRGSCAPRGADALRDYLKVRVRELGLPGVRVNQAGCLDRCEFGPVLVIYPEGVWYRPASREDVDAILEAHLRDGGRVPRLMLTARDVVAAAGGPGAGAAAPAEPPPAGSGPPPA